MKNLKILISWSRVPDIKNHFTQTVENIVSALELKTKVNLVWVICMPERITNTIQKENWNILDIHDYKNAFEIIKKERPDLIFASSSPNLIDYSFCIAGKSNSIPIISRISSNLSQAKISLKLNLQMFFDETVPTDSSEEQKKFMRRGKFFLYKCLFVFKTQLAAKMSIFNIMKYFFILIKNHLFYNDVPSDSIFENTLHYLSNENLIEPLVSAGFKKSRLLVTGDPFYDNFFKDIDKKNLGKKEDNKLNILFAPTTHYEHGFCTKTQQDEAITQIVKEILKHKNELSLTIKIHPSSAVYHEYEKMIKKIDPSLTLYQSGNIDEFLSNSDLVITFPYTTVMVHSLVFKKPTIVYNFYNAKGDAFVKNNLVLECKQSSEIFPAIQNVTQSSTLDNEKFDQFIKDYFYKLDGKASERISQSIINLLNK